MAALKVRGFYDSSLEGMEELFKTGDDNTLIKIEGIDQLTDATKIGSGRPPSQRS